VAQEALDLRIERPGLSGESEAVLEVERRAVAAGNKSASISSGATSRRSRTGCRVSRADSASTPRVAASSVNALR
jgi:hypothetical protein